MSKTEKIKEAIKLLIEVTNDAPEKGMPDLVTAKQAMQIMGVTNNTFYRLIKDGKVKPHRLSPRKLFVSLSELEAAIKAQ
jgi:predicted DNA-binding transcriptional regulator AlpA